MSERLLPGPVGALSGSVAVPSSKSLTNRALIAAAAAGGGTIIRPLDCEDTRLLASALEQTGWGIRWDGDIAVAPRSPVGSAVAELGNSGTGSRLIIGLLACVPGRFTVDGSPRLRQRPMRPLLDALRRLGSTVNDRDGFLPVTIDGGRLTGGSIEIRPEVSSQFVSALLLAAPLMEQGLDLSVSGPVPSRPYLDLTRQVLEAFGARVDVDGDVRWRVAPGGLRPTDYTVEGDWSAVAFGAAAVAVAGGSITISSLSGSSKQGDRAVCSILDAAGVDTTMSGDRLRVSGRATTAFEADLTATPDLFPALSVVAACCPPGSVLRGLDHLKHKESDRLSVMIDNLQRLGARFETAPTAVRVVQGLDRTRTSTVGVTAADDHRIAMSMAVAALAAGPLRLDDDACVGKSFPEFWTMWDHLVGAAGRLP